MVNSGGQLYTIEGLAAGLIMLVTAYMVMNATSIYSAGDAHISDMQLETLGSDALYMMDTPPNGSIRESPLAQIVQDDDGGRFKDLFLKYSNVTGFGPKHDVQFSASYTYESAIDASVVSVPINASRNITGGEHAVRVTRWVFVNKALPATAVKENRAVLVEVLLWRD